MSAVFDVLLHQEVIYSSTAVNTCLVTNISHRCPVSGFALDTHGFPLRLPLPESAKATLARAVSAGGKRGKERVRELVAAETSPVSPQPPASWGGLLQTLCCCVHTRQHPRVSVSHRSCITASFIMAKDGTKAVDEVARQVSVGANGASNLESSACWSLPTAVPNRQNKWFT